MVPKALLVLPERDFDETEYSVIKSTLESRGVAVMEASTSLGPAIGRNGLLVRPDLVLAQIKVEDWDAVIFVGGDGAAQYWREPSAHLLARAAWAAERVVAALDTSVVTLANAGILSGLNATVDAAHAPLLEAQGANYTGTPLERDGNIITGRGPEVADKLALEMARILKRRGRRGEGS